MAAVALGSKTLQHSQNCGRVDVLRSMTICNEKDVESPCEEKRNVFKP